jgi:hypothetical protein
MAAVTPANVEIQVEEVKPDFSVNAGTFSRIAGAVNYAQKKQFSKIIDYTIPGVYSFTCPTNITEILIEAIGGGGGGYAGVGSGGGGSVLTQTFYPVIPGNNYSLTVGAGGGASAQGGSTIFDGVTLSQGGPGGVVDTLSQMPLAGGTVGRSPFLGGLPIAADHYRNSLPTSTAKFGPGGNSGGFGGGGASLMGSGGSATGGTGSTGAGGAAPSGSGGPGYLAIYAIAVN